MIEKIIKQIAEKYGAKVIFNHYTDAFWKCERKTAELYLFRDYIEKLNCQYEIRDEFRRVNLDANLIGEFNNDFVKFDWRTTDEELPED